MNETLLDRRREMMKGGWREIARITTVGTTTLTLPHRSKLGFFIVGGGGSGRGDFGSKQNSGNGGNGGCVNSFIVPFTTTTCTVTVGAGGAQSKPLYESNNGSASSVTYNGETYVSEGGYGGSNRYNVVINTKQLNSGIGGSQNWVGYENSDIYLWASTHIALETYPGTSSTVHYGSKGEDGLPNPFDKKDEHLYGAGGAAGQNAYYPTYVGPAMPGGITGGGAGGYGDNNTKNNRGQAGTFYGAGGGGGSFNSSHKTCWSGAGYQGIVIIYGK